MSARPLADRRVTCDREMKFLSITGPKDDVDRVVEQYLSKYEIQLENALSELKTVANLRPYLEINPYKAELQAAAALMEEIQGAVDVHDAQEAKPLELRSRLEVRGFRHRRPIRPGSPWRCR